jgi:hypothetical protein
MPSSRGMCSEDVWAIFALHAVLGPLLGGLAVAIAVLPLALADGSFKDGLLGISLMSFALS